MYRVAFLFGAAVVAVASLLFVPQSSYAQYHSFPGDWSQPGRGPGFGHSGFERVGDTLPFPYDGLSNAFAAPVYGQPAAAAAIAALRTAPAPARDNRRAYVHVAVPADARVFFEDEATTQRGADRLFVSPPLQTGANYTYQISARWMQNGQERRESRTVRVVPGQTADVDFTTPPRGQ